MHDHKRRVRYRGSLSGIRFPIFGVRHGIRLWARARPDTCGRGVWRHRLVRWDRTSVIRTRPYTQVYVSYTCCQHTNSASLLCGHIDQQQVKNECWQDGNNLDWHWSAACQAWHFLSSVSHLASTASDLGVLINWHGHPRRLSLQFVFF